MSRSPTCSALFTAFSLFGIIVAEYSIDSNGWIPVSHETIYNQIRRHTSYYPQKNKFDVPIPQDNISNSIWLKQKEIEDSTDISTENNHPKKDTLHHISGVSDYNKLNSKEVTRKAKTINEYIDYVNVDRDNIIGYKTDTANPTYAVRNNEGETEKREVIADEAFANTYEVTEDPKTDITTENQNDATKRNDYQYKSFQNQNLTSKFFEILSKYNINPNDKLRNYELSRQNRVLNPMEHIPMYIPYKYNSPNHSPIDPLFAVFLSNYGFYLPGVYGIKGNYNNLYGYLASNNLHNNKPFGLYKIYSDTDSSN